MILAKGYFCTAYWGGLLGSWMACVRAADKKLNVKLLQIDSIVDVLFVFNEHSRR
jgi:hypothetical protein